MKIINKRKIFLTLSGTLMLVSILVWIAWGLRLGIDFTGGSLMEIQYQNTRPSADQVRAELADFNLDSLNIQPTGEKGYILRFKSIDEDTHQQILTKLEADQNTSQEENTNTEENTNSDNLKIESLGSDTDSPIDISGVEVVSANGADADTANSDAQAGNVVELRFDNVGPSIGKELQSKSIWAILVVVIAIILYIAWSFRKVSYPVTSWKYGIVAIIALLHDILITLGVFVFLGKFWGIEVNTPFVAALLTILGYSVNDTIVIFDRIRENLHRYEGEFEEIVDKSVVETISRSVNTALTTELVLLAILFFGGTTIHDFVLTLVVGIFLGTYSSIFIASPILVIWQKLDWRLKKS